MSLTWEGIIAKAKRDYPPLWVHIDGSRVVAEGRATWTIELKNALDYERILTPTLREKLREFSGGQDLTYVINPDTERERLKAIPYREYLETDHWNAVRIRALRLAEFACQLCNIAGAETEKDVIVLCKDCHATFHKERKLA